MLTIILSEPPILKYDNMWQGWIGIILFLSTSISVLAQHPGQPLDIQGHRGCRGLLPENTIPAFLEAVRLGVTTLEMDAIISQDGQVVVSHEPFLSHLICHNAKGEPISEKDEKEYNLYQMSYAEIAQCDCGSKPNPGFPEQENFTVHKPLLSQVIDTVEQFVKQEGLSPIRYNIETKSSEEGDDVFHPKPAKFTQLLLRVIQEKNIQDRTTIQSFDVRTLQEIRKTAPAYPLALLIGNTDSPQENVEKLGFTPEIYSPHFKLADTSLLDYAREVNMQVVPWTVNEPEDIRSMIELGVDGIISDYPNRVIEITSK